MLNQTCPQVIASGVAIYKQSHLIFSKATVTKMLTL